MAGSTFQTNPIDLNKLLDDCHCGIIQLPDFQRSWVWDEERIKSLIASISRAFPVGALMSLDTGGPVNFKPRRVEGAPREAKDITPQSLLLDGQQRVTSLYQVALRGKVVETVTPKRKKVARWFYIDIRKALDPSTDREEAIVGVPTDKIERTNFGRDVTLDLSTAEREYGCLMYPVSQVLIGTGGKTDSTATGVVIIMKVFVKSFGVLSVRFLKTSNITEFLSLVWIGLLPRRLCALYSKR